jgi:large subunit ribosomal protein L30
MNEEKKCLAAVLVRGLIGANRDVKDTARMLNLERKFSCAVLHDTPVTRGMLHKVKDYVTYGEITEETLKLLDSKREKKNNHYKLSPPRGGFERKGIKQPYTTHGALGYRGAKMNDLLRKMI